MPHAFLNHFEYLGSATEYVADIHEIFGGVPLFGRLDLAETTQLANFMGVYSAHMNTVLQAQGSTPEGMVILLTGSAEVVRTHPDGSQTRLRLLKPGDTYGELAMLEGAPLRASCVSLEPVDLVVISAQAFKDILLNVPRLGNKLLLLFLHIASQQLHAAEDRAAPEI